MFQKNKQDPLISLNELKSGCATDDLKSYKLKNGLDQKKSDEFDRLSFVIVYDNFSKTLQLKAASETERNRWVRVLSYFILLTKKRKGVLPEADQ